MSELLTLQEAADAIGCHYMTLYRRVRGGEETVIQVVLPMHGQAAAPETAAAPASGRAGHEDRSASRRKLWIWTSVGVAAATALAVGLAVGLKDHDKTKVEEPDRSRNTPPDVILMALGRH